MASVLALVVGAVLVNCISSALDDGDGTSSAGECCTPPGATFTKLAEGDVPRQTMADLPAFFTTEPIATEGYRELVYDTTMTRPPGEPLTCHLSSRVLFRPDADTVFGYTGINFGEHGGRIRVDGSHVRIEFSTESVLTGSPNCPLTFHYVVAGVR